MMNHDWSLRFIFLAGVITLSAQTPRPTCNATHFCNYPSGSLSTIPSGISDDILGLDLAFNNISQIKNTDLKFAVNLRVLLLQFNQIQTIEDNAFDFLVRLEHLDLSNNRLAHLSAFWFKTLSSLQKLNIKGNYYLGLGETSLFPNLQKLKYLHLGNDRFSTLRKQDLEGIPFLEELEIEGRSLTTFEQIGPINHIILNAFPINTLLSVLSNVTYSATCLEMRNMQFNFLSTSFSQEVNFVGARKLILRNVVISDDSAVKIASLLMGMKNMTELEFVDSKFNGVGDFNGIENFKSSIKVIVIRNITIGSFYRFTDLSSVKELVQNITKLTVENSKVFLMPCERAEEFHSLLYLDFSVNLLLDGTLKLSVPCNGKWPQLQTLNVSQNNLKRIGIVSQSLAETTTLLNLDISQNNFEDMPDKCVWPQGLQYLNVSGCKLSRLTNCIPQTLSVLDVSNNNLQEFTLNLPNLKELYIKNNKLEILPDASFIPHVEIMNIRENQLLEFNEQQIRGLAEMKKLDARDNNLKCTCEFLSFVQSQKQVTKVLVEWPENYVCDSPDYVRGKQVGSVRLPVTDCHMPLILSSICVVLVLVILVSAVLCYKLHALWYIQMIWAWLQAKHKPQREHNKEITYDAFVSYSEQDSEWVESVMVQELERATPPFRLCLHKRDFVPGTWIVDNIIDSIEKSYKTIFVLSRHFVQSEWCKYELDFSHFRLFDEKNDTAVLILLEHISEQTVPKRFCKLRKLMNTRTYLEWSEDEAGQHMFWFNLKTALKC